MISSIIFSKDRPLQLDLCLNSIKKNFVNCNQTIVIHNNSDVCSETDKTIQSEHPEVEFWRQGRSLYRDLYSAVTSVDNDYVCFFTDDCIFFSKFEIADLNFWGTDVLTMALRMGQNITEREHGGDGIKYPDPPAKLYSVENYNLIAWPRTYHLYGSYWSYALSVDGGVFSKDTMTKMLDEICSLEDKYQWPQTPNGVEVALQRFWTSAEALTVSPPTSVVVNSPNNRVQGDIANESGNSYSQSNLDMLDAYLLGSRVNLDLLNFANIKCPHTEIDLMGGLT